MTMNLNRLDWLVTLFVLLCCSAIVILMMATGCILNPGAQVREALSQTKTYEWTETGTIRVHGIGPQEESFLMMEGSIVMDEDGEIDWPASRITHYLRSEPSADEAMAGMAAIMLANIEQSKAFYASLESTLELVAAVIPTLPPPAGEAVDDGS